ncbi:MAG: restriction endonuclease subunit [Actinomycetota bacterium]|nr:restriction endonuclease subunit [Actinomycetota bacterium]
MSGGAPDGWARPARLGDVAEINPRLKSDLSADDEVSFVPLAALDIETACTPTVETRLVGEVSTGYTPMRDGDILLAKITPSFENGKIGQATLGHRYGFGSTEFHVVRPRECLEDRYLLHFLRRSSFRLKGVARMTGSAGQKRVPVNYLAETRIPLPPLPEQRRIAAILDHADALRAKRRQVLAHLDSLTQSIFHDMFGDPVLNPRGLPISELDDLIENGRPITYGILKPGPDTPGGVPYVRVADMQGGGIAASRVRRTTKAISGTYRRSLLREGDLLMSIRGHVGRFAHIPPELHGANITQDSARLSIPCAATSVYVRAAMSTTGLQHWMARHTKGVAVRGLNIGDLRRVPIPVPPDNEQFEFATLVRCVDTQRASMQAALAADDELFASLQSRAFRGEL